MNIDNQFGHMNHTNQRVFCFPKLTHVQMDFKSPARLNDQLEVYTGVKKLGNSSMTFMQEIYKVGSDEVLNSANITWVNTNQKSMKSETIPDDIRSKLNKYLID